MTKKEKTFSGSIDIIEFEKGKEIKNALDVIKTLYPYVQSICFYVKGVPTETLKIFDSRSECSMNGEWE